MNREIKFRAFDNVNKLWLYGFSSGANFDVSTHSDGLHGDEPDDVWLENLILTPWQQFTGLKDKNGKDIYEGDIMKFGTDGDDQIDVVEYGAGEHYPAFDFKGNTMESNGLSTFKEMGDTFEVIGNVWENPSFLQAPPASEEPSQKSEEPKKQS